MRGGTEVCVVMGNYGVGVAARTINKGNVTVPNRIWKVQVLLPEEESDLQRIKTSMRLIAMDTSNSNTGCPDWSTYHTSVDAIEQAIGYVLLDGVPVQKTLVSQVDTGRTR